MSDQDKKSFIVTLKENASAAKFKEGLSKLGGEITHEYTLIKGFAVKLPGFHADSLKKHDEVATVEEDKEVKTQ
ncbi:hypothetical protein WICANDRAFT_62546 [Wickerhamomyces anomalus NRRL Y-366-8]|uniref:Inhibitor I9 domain-containing protein n=1 Tax=Wickerhamomyces anomalus (strain ATCC 58044 / CBS 1984 / NCYC 433 / NRRL Y-366-8) TaxID=683960 RepID=A0A1E3P401_WICAA|nr:uncharacterized protein WICANDRAFT_62546 [Wickerhamomyces anomalus NRRL Y-366-8]ODQ59970.1 hypothetical protein WICANDRAFT_62546 [Wickerhamomyces anomalus NRRL Y-366-8]